MKHFAKFATIIAALVLGASARADLLVYYSFNTTNQIPGDQTATNQWLTADTGSGISSFSFKQGGAPILINFAGLAVNNQPGFIGGGSAGGNTWQGTTNYYQFTLNAAGYQDLMVSFAANRSATGPTNMLFQYDIGGGLQTIATIGITANANTGYTQDLSAITALNNQNITFRLTSQGASSGGTIRLDNLTINGVPIIPEPSTVMLVGLGLIGFVALRRRR